MRKLFWLALAGIISAASPIVKAATSATAAPAPSRKDPATAVAPKQTATNEYENIVVSVIVNTRAKGEHFIFLASDGRLFMLPADLDKLTGRKQVWQTIALQDENVVPLATLKGLKAQFNEEKLELALNFPPEFLEESTINLGPKRRQNVQFTNNNSLFLNYRFGQSGNDTGATINMIAGEIGLRLHNWLLESDFIQSSSPTEKLSLRLNSSLTLDRREALQRLVLGDFSAYSGELGGGVNLGGISFSKRFNMDPYLIRQPMANLAGTVSTPSQAEIYVDGIRVRTENLAPGQFRIDQLNYYGGARDIQIVIKDAFGRQEVIAYRYYFTDTLLKTGLHEYSYNIGKLRLNYGVESNNYGPWIASANHRAGITDDLTLGLRGEASAQRANFGPEATVRLGNFGTLAMQTARSNDLDLGGGTASLLRYGYLLNGLNLRAATQRFSDNYLPVSADEKLDRTVRQDLAGIGYGLPWLGNFDISRSTTKTLAGKATQTLSLGYSRPLLNHLNFFARFARTQGTETHNEVFMGLSWFPQANQSAGYTHSQRRESTSEQFQFGQNPPLGEGWGYRLQLERSRSADSVVDTTYPYVQYNGPYGSYSAQYVNQTQSHGGRQGSYEVSAAGALSLIDGKLAWSRPINDSFALVDLSGIPDVRVYQNNQLMGRTDRQGRMLIPNVGAYVDNEISIKDSDIPIEYSLSEKLKYISPMARSGALVSFKAIRIQAITGYLMFLDKGQRLPAEHYEARLSGMGTRTTMPTGKGGEFYLENLAPGSYQGKVTNKDKQTCQFSLTIPESNEMQIEAGVIDCVFIP